MTQTTTGPGVADDQLIATAYRQSITAMDSAEELLRALPEGRELRDDTTLAISRSLSEALRGLNAMAAAAKPGSEEARRAGGGMGRFDQLLKPIAAVGLLPDR